jgi:hypothetical protein
MVITYFGNRFLKLQYGDTTIGVNPPAKGSPLSSKMPSFGADIALSCSSDPAVAGASTLAYGDRVPFVIDGPGSYEVKGIFLSGGFLSEVKGRRENAYVLTLEGMSVAVLGVAATTEMPGETREMLSNPDILIVPVNAEGGLTPKDAAKMALSLEPLIIIPVLYGEKENAEALKTFIKEVGEENPVVTDKLTLKRKDLEGKDATVIIITPEVK